MLFALAPAPPRAGLQTLDYVGVGVYLLITLAIIVWSSRRQNTTEDFFLGGRSMPWLAVGMSLMATLLSTISYLAVPGEMIKNGVTMYAGYLAIPFSMAVVLLVWVPFFMRLRMTSAYEYLQQRFDYRARLLASLLFLLLRLGWMSLVVYTASLALEELTGWKVRNVIVFVGAAATLYTCAGGLRAAIWNDVLQFVMLFGGTFVILIYVMATTGAGPMQWWQTISATASEHTSPPLFSLDLTVRMTIVTAMMHNFFWTICTHGSDQVVLQRYFSTTSLSAARKSYIVNAVSDIAVGLLLALSGLALLYFYTKFPDNLPATMSTKDKADKVLPYFFAHQLPVGLGGLILAGFMCDAMQTLVSGVNSISAVVTKDLFPRLTASGRRWTSEVAVARILTLLAGAVVTLLALGVANHTESMSRNIVDLMPRAFNMFLGPLAALFFIGMFLPRATSRSAIPAVLCGLAVAIVWSYWSEIPGLLKYLRMPSAADSWVGILGRDDAGKAKVPTITLTIAVPYLGSFLLAGLLSLLVESRSRKGSDLTWFAVMRRPESPSKP